MARNVWWVQLTRSVRYLCNYLTKHKNQLPPDLTYQVQTFYAALVIFCDALEFYDAAHARGKKG